MWLVHAQWTKIKYKEERELRPQHKQSHEKRGLYDDVDETGIPGRSRFAALAARRFPFKAALINYY
jgi:hypothetical protein